MVNIYLCAVYASLPLPNCQPPSRVLTRKQWTSTCSIKIQGGSVYLNAKISCTLTSSRVYIGASLENQNLCGASTKNP